MPKLNAIGMPANTSTNSTTNISSGSHAAIEPIEVNPSSPSAQWFWKTAVMTPSRSSMTTCSRTSPPITARSAHQVVIAAGYPR